MKNKELTKQLRDEVIAKYEAGLGYLTIFKALNIGKNVVQTIKKRPSTQTSKPAKEEMNQRSKPEGDGDSEGAAKCWEKKRFMPQSRTDLLVS